MVEVTQADRNFAAPWIAQSVQSFSERSAYRKEIEAGEHDAHPMVIAAATHRIEAAKAERDRLRELAAGPAAWLGRWAKHVGDCQGGCVCSCGLTLAQMEAEQLIAALESKP